MISRASSGPPRRIPASIRWPTSSAPFAGRRSRVAGHDSQAIFEAATGACGGKRLMVWRLPPRKGVSYMEMSDRHYRSAEQDEYRKRCWSSRRRMRNTFSRRSTRRPQEPRIYIVVGRHLAGRRHGGSSAPNIRALHQCLRRRAELIDLPGLRSRAASPSPTRSRPSRSTGRSRWCATIFCYQNLPVTVSAWVPG